MRSKVHSGVILSISASSQTAKVRADNDKKHIRDDRSRIMETYVYVTVSYM